MALGPSLTRLFSSKLHLSRAILRPNTNAGVVPIAGKLTVTEELGLPTPPKQPQRGYFLWVNKIRKEFKAKHPHLSYHEVHVKLAEVWSQLSLQEREKWNDQYKQEKVVFDQKYKEYLETLTPDQIKSIKDLQNIRKKLRKEQKSSEDKPTEQDKKSNKKDSKLLGKPKHPKSPFALFMMSQDRDGFSPKEFFKETATRWKQLSDSEQQWYIDTVAKDREQYQKDLLEWKRKMVKIGRSDLV